MSRRASRKDVDHVELMVTVISARGLRRNGGTGKPDPYCICEVPGRLEPASFQTEVKSRTSDPVWNQPGYFADYLPGESIKFRIFDQDGQSNGGLLGTATLTSEHIHPDGFSGEVALQEAGSEQHAFLQVTVDFHGPGNAGDCLLEGPLETRGPGIIGKWETKWFRVAGGSLKSFSMEDTARARAQRSVRLGDIETLEVDEAACECSFHALGAKVRLRAKSVEDLRPWLEALRPGCSTQESIQEVVTDVCLQVDTIFGVPKLREPDPEQTCAYFMRARWMGETMEIRAKSCHPEPGSTPYVENVTVKQQVPLRCSPGAQVIILTLFRLADAEEKIGECRLDINDPSNLEVRMHQLQDKQGRSMSTAIRMRLKLFVKEVDVAADAAAVRASTRASTRTSQAKQPRVTYSGNKSARVELPYEPPPRGRSSSRPELLVEPELPDELPAELSSKQTARPEARTELSTELSETELSEPESPRTRPANALRINILGARVLLENGAYAHGQSLECYCACQLQGKPRTRIQTQPAAGHGTDPEWNHSAVMQGYAPGDSLDFAIFHSGERTPLGRLRVPSSHFDPHALSEELQATEARQGCRVFLAVQITACVAGSSKRAAAKKASAKGHRFDELYALHARKKLDMERRRKYEEEMERQRLEAEVARRRIQHGVQRRDEKADDVCTRLYAQHFEAEMRLKELQATHDREQVNKVEESRSRRIPKSSSTPSLRAQEATAERLHGHAERRKQWIEQELKAKERKEREELEALKRPNKEAGSSFNKEQLTERLYAEDIQKRKDAEAKRKKEQDERQDAELNKFFANKGSDLKGMSRIEELYEDHAARLKRRQEELLKKRTDEESAARQASAPGSPRSQRWEELYNEAEERRRRMSRTQKDVVNQIRTQAGEKNPSSSSRKKPEPHTPADITLASVISAMQARTGIRTPLEPAELKALGEPLKTAMAMYKKAQVLCSRAPGYETLSHRPSLVLFQDDLVPEVHAVGSCVEPDPIRQVEHDLSALMATAELAQRQLLQKLQLDGLEDAEEFPLGVIEAQSMAVPMAQFIYNPGPKKQERAETKAFVRYAPSAGQKQYQHLLDLARATLVFENCETLMAGLQAMLESDLYDILEVRNHFTTPLRTGRRYVDVLVTVDVPLPHVCELRFEEVHFQKATFRAQQHLEEFLDALCTIYSKRSSVRPDYLHYLAESVLASAPDPGSLRKFRCFFAKSFGTSVCGWRSKFGSCGRNLQFQAFRQACCALKHREHTTGYWMAMDAGRANTVSLFELDPEAVVLLTRVRSRLLTLVDSRVPEVVRADAIYVKLKERSPPSAPLGLNEFRAGAKPLGVSPAEADRAFAYLDAKGGGPMASLTVADINWLLNLPSMVYLEAACLGQTDFAVDERLSSPPQRPRAQQGLRPEASAAGCAPAGAGAGVAAAGLASAGLAGAGALSCQEDAEEAAHEDEGGEQEYAADKGEPQEEEQEEAAVDQGEAQEEEQEEGDDAADKGEAQEEAQEAAEEDEDEEEGEEVEEESGEEEAEEADGHAAADAGEDEEECTF